MADWNTLFYDQKNIELAPEPEIIKFIERLTTEFPNERALKIWDLGCGGGRHSIVVGKMGCEVFISDNSSKAIELSTKRLEENTIDYIEALTSMENYPWSKKEFLHGVFSWAVLQHSTLDKITESIDCIHESLLAGGYFLGTIKSTKADLYGKGEEIEKDTFVLEMGIEEGVPHHYFDKKGIKQLFPDDKWEMTILAEQVVNYIEKAEEFWSFNPFRYTTWCVLAKKRERVKQ